MTACCDDCLRRGHLLGLLAPRISGALARRDAPPGLLALGDADLVAAVCASPQRRAEAEAFLERFEAAAARAALAERGVEAVCRHDAAYPRGLLELADPPAALFVAGGVERLRALAGAHAVTIVGARRGTPYGLEMAASLGRGLAAAGLTVVSGLALGVDAAAHRGACAAPAGGALAVIACGPEHCYPPGNRDVYEAVLERGCVVSEFPPRTPIFRWAFPARNRIMAALARITIVVEAGDPSGSLITADFAAQLGRDVAAVPNRVGTPVAAGSNALLRDGAHVVLDPADVLDILFEGTGPRPDPPPAPRLGDERLQRVYDAVDAVDTAAEIASLCGLPASQVRAALGRLEAMGLVRRGGAGRWTRRRT